MTRPVHLHVLRRWRLEGIGLRAGVGALAASLVALALAAPSGWHLAAIALGAALAAAWPLRRDERRALAWVGERVGLAYETAWETSSAPSPADARAAALRAAVEVQGRLSVRDLRPPPAAAWWLPLATIAVGVWLWAAWSAGDAARVPTGPAAGPPPTTTSTPLPTDEAQPEDVAPAEPAALDAPEEATEARGGDGGREAASADAGAPSEGGAPAERDVLDRFLDRLRERPPEEAAAARAAQAAGVAAEEDDEEEGDDPVVPGGDPLRAGEPPDAQDPGSERRPGGEGDEEGSGEPGDDRGAGGNDDEGAGEPGDTGDQEGAGPETAGDPSGSPDAAGEGSAEPFGVEEGSDEASAGIGVSAPGESGPAADPAAGDPEPLPSLLGPGEESPIGGVQLPGAGPDGGFPSGEAGTEFRRGVEEALNEGDLPAAYQEVIRNYFR